MMNSRPAWIKLLLFSSGLTLAAAICMKLLEASFDGFTILGLELVYSREKITSLLRTIPGEQLALLRYNLWFDFAFMAGVYPLIASLCMLASLKAGRQIKLILIALAFLQVIAWICDVIENLYLLKWSAGSNIPVLGLYHFFVWVKWILAISGILASLPFLVRRNGHTNVV